MTPFKQAVLDHVGKIPMGKLVYFGQISKAVGGTAQTVGWVLSGLSVEESRNIPWHRVVAKNGYISSLKLGDKGHLQKMLLVDEGFEVVEDRVDIKRLLWNTDEQDESIQSLF